MTRSLEVPGLVELQQLGSLLVEAGAAEWAVALTAYAGNGGCVRLSWDQVARSVSLVCEQVSGDRTRLDRESVTRVAVSEDRGRVRFVVQYQPGDHTGQLTVEVAEHVVVEDSLLQV